MSVPFVRSFMPTLYASKMLKQVLQFRSFEPNESYIFKLVFLHFQALLQLRSGIKIYNIQETKYK
jgi:hypothetical protein